MVPKGATHILDGRYYNKAPHGGAYCWCVVRQRWRYMEDRTSKKVMATATRLIGPR